MSEPSTDRRHESRLARTQEHGVTHARVRAGHAVSVIDISASGVRLETRHRLMPGVRVELHLRRAGEIEVIRGRVVRCGVVRLCRDAISYQGAVSFDRPLGWLQQPAREYPVPASITRSNPAVWADATHRRA